MELKQFIRESILQSLSITEESVDSETLRRMRDFGLSKNDIDDEGYVTLYHGGKKLPTKLNKDEIFFMTPWIAEAEDYANMRQGTVFTIKVKPELCAWNIGSREVEYDMGGKLIDGVITPSPKRVVDKVATKEKWIDDTYKSVLSYDRVNVGYILPSTNRKILEIILNTKTNTAQFNLGNNQWYDAKMVLTYEFGEEK